MPSCSLISQVPKCVSNHEGLWGSNLIWWCRKRRNWENPLASTIYQSFVQKIQITYSANRTKTRKCKTCAFMSRTTLRSSKYSCPPSSNHIMIQKNRSLKNKDEIWLISKIHLWTNKRRFHWGSWPVLKSNLKDWWRILLTNFLKFEGTLLRS